MSVTNITYGKSRVRLTKVGQDSLTEIAVDISLAGAFEKAYTDGDNSRVVATDSMKNIVLALAGDHSLDSIESFALHLARFFRDKYEQVTSATIRIEKPHWQRVAAHNFVAGGQATSVTTVTDDRVVSGLTGLVLLKTTGSGFAGFVRDEYTTLAETGDRILATEVEAEWHFARDGADWRACRAAIRRALVETFAEHESSSLQQTLYEMGRAALAACDAVDEIALGMSNKHHHRVGNVFVPTDEPFGLIRGTVTRNVNA